MGYYCLLPLVVPGVCCTKAFTSARWSWKRGSRSSSDEGVPSPYTLRRTGARIENGHRNSGYTHNYIWKITIFPWENPL